MEKLPRNAEKESEQLNLVEEHLYLGTLLAAKDVNLLTKHNITHILTLDTCPLPRNILSLKHIIFKYVQLSDLPKEDLLVHFNETYIFIDDAVSNGNILVHCYFGVSRSPAVVIAYLMKKYELTYSEAFDRVKAKRSIIHPNHGFVSQLHIYKEMNYTLDSTNKKYKIFRLIIAADRFKNVKVLPQNFADLIKPDPGLTQIQPESNVYRCKRCRRVVAGESNLLQHQDKDKLCTKILFVEPISWMQVTHRPQGKLHCPNCNAKLGSFSWIMGCECLCKVKVAPAFYLTPSKVDFSYVVKNVEITF